MTDGPQVRWRKVAPDDRRAMPWRNGFGTTHEIAVAGARPAGGFSWRISSAEVTQACPFSTFAGVDRTLMLVQGDGLELTIDGAAHRLDTPLVPLRFAGEATVTCRLLGGPVVDFNVMTDRAHAAQRVEVIHLVDRARITADGLALAIHVFDGLAVAHIGAREPLRLRPGDTLVGETEPAGPLALDIEATSAGRLALVRVLPRP